MAAAAMASAEPVSSKSEKKHKKDKSSKSEKKRAREEDIAADTERKHKKSKSISTAKIKAEENDSVQSEAEVSHSDVDVKHQKKRKKKEKKPKDEQNGDTAADAEVVKSEKKKHKKKQKDANGDIASEDDIEAASEEKPKKKKSKKHNDEDVETQVQQTSTDHDDSSSADADVMDVDEPAQSASSNIYQPPDIPANPQFPFYAQTVSLYEPIYPIGWAQPVTNCEYQHLQHLKNKYVPSLRGVLMNYKNVALGENPGRKGAATEDEEPSTLKSFNEYAVGFGWITADVELFIPSRGAWMEGSVNLQTEGHIGVVCFGKFNASIEARRLPSAWKWVSNEDPEAQGMEETASVITADDHGVVRQIHSTGFWVDGSGKKVKGRIRFRIRNFDVGISGETSYLSLEGTMLDKDSEKKLVKEEARMAATRKAKKGGRKPERRRAPEFAMTRFADESEQTEGQATEDREQEGHHEPV